MCPFEENILGGIADGWNQQILKVRAGDPPFTHNSEHLTEQAGIEICWCVTTKSRCRGGLGTKLP